MLDSPVRRTLLAGLIVGVSVVATLLSWPHLRQQQQVRSRIESLASNDESLRLETIKSLASFGAGAKAAVPKLAELLADENSSTEHRKTLAETLGAIGPSAQPAVDTLILAMKDPRVTVPAGEALAKIGPPATVPALTRALRHDDAQIRAGAAHALGIIGPESKDAVPALISALEDEEKDVRWQVAAALWQIGPNAHTADPALRNLVENTDDYIRPMAAKAVGHISLQEAVPFLVKLLEDDDYRVRVAAAQSLGHIGADAKDAVPALAARLRNEDGSKDGYVAEALQQINGRDVAQPGLH